MSLKERLGLDKEPLYLIDGSAYVYRAFYAYQDMQRSDGFPTNAVYNVLRLVFKLLREEKPRYLGFVLDGRGPTFRHELYEPYKAQRAKAPEALIRQIEPVKEGIARLGVDVEVPEGYEADDFICSMAARFKGERPVVIVGADKDLQQCLDSHVCLWDPQSKQEKLVRLEDFRTQYGLEPDQWPDFQALIGDSSDNIPGIPGVGPKTAIKLFDEFASLEELKDGWERIEKKGLREKVRDHMEDVFLYRRLTALRRDLDPDTDLERFRVRPMDPEAVTAFLQEYEFRSLLRDLPGLVPAKARERFRKNAPAGGEQLSLFGDARTGRTPEETAAVAAAADLPDLSGALVALVPTRAEGADHPVPVLGLDNAELLYTGAEEPLARALAGAGRIFHPDVKALLRGSPHWKHIELSRWCDLGLAAYLLNPEERDYGWEHLARRWSPELAAHPENPGLLALELGQELDTRLHAADLDTLLRELEMPLIPVLAAMEEAGVAIDRRAFADFLDEVQAELERISQRIFQVAGGAFNLRSSQQLADLLFTTLELPPAGKTPGGAPSTSNTVLEKLRGKHPVVEDILEFRTLEKLRSTYLEPLPRLAGPDGRLHTTFNQLATATGRLSSSNPNLQNIPIRGRFGPRMRACFVAGPGKRLVAADYSQIELRVLAHMSGDPTLLEAFRKGQDIHSRTAGLLFDKEPDQVSADERRGAKTINFGLIYGMGPQKLAQELKTTMNEAKAFIERYFQRLSRLRAFYDEIVAHAEEHGWVTTWAGRRRLIRDIHSRNSQLQSQARRQAINTRIQGSAADIIKLAMLAAHNDPELRALDARLLLQVHDELVLEVPADRADAAGERLAALMAGVAALDVPLAVDWGARDNWDQAH